MRGKSPASSLSKGGENISSSGGGARGGDGSLGEASRGGRPPLYALLQGLQGRLGDIEERLGSRGLSKREPRDLAEQAAEVVGAVWNLFGSIGPLLTQMGG